MDKITNETKIICYNYECFYNVYKNCSKTEIEIVIEKGVPICSEHISLK